MEQDDYELFLKLKKYITVFAKNDSIANKQHENMFVLLNMLHNIVG